MTIIFDIFIYELLHSSKRESYLTVAALSCHGIIVKVCQQENININSWVVRTFLDTGWRWLSDVGFDVVLNDVECDVGWRFLNDVECDVA